MQIVTAAMLLWGIFRPLPSNCLVPGWKVPVKARKPSLAAVKHFMVYAGPIGGVLGIKTFLYSKQILSKLCRVCVLPSQLQHVDFHMLDPD